MASSPLLTSSILCMTLASFLVASPLSAGKNEDGTDTAESATPTKSAPAQLSPLELKRKESVSKILWTVCEKAERPKSNFNKEEPPYDSQLLTALAAKNEDQLDDFTTGFALNLLSTLPPKIKPGSDSDRVTFLAHAATSGKSSEELKKIVALFPCFDLYYEGFSGHFQQLKDLFQMEFSQLQAILDFTFAISDKTINTQSPFTRSKVFKLGNMHPYISGVLKFKEFSGEKIRAYSAIFTEWGAPLFRGGLGDNTVISIVTSLMRHKTPAEIKPFVEALYSEESTLLRKYLDISGWFNFFQLCAPLTPDQIKGISSRMALIADVLQINPDVKEHKENIESFFKAYDYKTTFSWWATKFSPQDIASRLDVTRHLEPNLRRGIFLHCFTISAADVTYVLTIVENLLKCSPDFQSESDEKKKIELKTKLIKMKVNHLVDIRKMEESQKKAALKAHKEKMD